MSDMQSSKPSRRRRNPIGGPQPLVIPSNPNTDAAYVGHVETYQERVERIRFLEDLYGKQDDELPRTNEKGR